MIKKTQKHFIIIATLLLCAACCVPKDQACQGLDSIQEVIFKNFYYWELDTIYIKKYISNTNFTNAIDSAIIQNPGQSDSTIFSFSLPLPMTVNYDYIIFIKDTNDEFKITHINLSNGTCKDCNRKSYSFKYISSLKVNNIVQSPRDYPPFISIQN
ncbi:MAG: hypothetical protein JWN78_2505 [Bacteroidota bacterium]|nr:hypothetical protein [Bacteroidota bacterium]